MAFNSYFRNPVFLLKLYYVGYNFRLYYGVAVVYFAQITQSYALALSIFSVVQLAQALGEVPLGYISDKWGRNICLKVGAHASLISVLFFAVGHNYWLLVVGAIFEGITRSAFSGNNDALLYEALAECKQEKRYAQEFGTVSSWLEGSGFIGTVLGSFIALYSVPLLFRLSVIPQVFAVMISWFIAEPKTVKEPILSLLTHLKTALKTYRHSLKIRYISLASILSVAIGGSTWWFQGVFYNQFLPAWVSSLVLSLNFLTSSISFRLSGWLIVKYKAMKVLIYQEIYSRALYLIALILPSVASPLLMALASVSYGPCTVAQSMLLQQEFTNTQRATMSSVNSLLGNILFAVVSIGLGFLADLFGATKAILVAQLCFVSVVFLYLKLARILTRP